MCNWFLTTLNMIFNVILVTFWMTLMDKWTIIVMDDGRVHPLAKTLPSFVINSWWNIVITNIGHSIYIYVYINSTTTHSMILKYSPPKANGRTKISRILSSREILSLTIPTPIINRPGLDHIFVWLGPTPPTPPPLPTPTWGNSSPLGTNVAIPGQLSH